MTKSAVSAVVYFAESNAITESFLNLLKVVSKETRIYLDYLRKIFVIESTFVWYLKLKHHEEKGHFFCSYKSKFVDSPSLCERKEQKKFFNPFHATDPF